MQRRKTFIIPGLIRRFTAVAFLVLFVSDIIAQKPANRTSSRQVNQLQQAQPEVDVELALRPGETVEEKVRNNFFLRANTNKTSCYVGEPIAVNYKAYSRLHSNSQVAKRPAFPGFSVVEMVSSYDNNSEVEVVNGKAFYTDLIRKVQLFPLQAGKYELDPAEVETVVHLVKTNNAPTEGASQLQQLLERSGATDNSYRSRLDHRTTLRTPPVTITVKPLPVENQPADFSGAVGEYSLSAKLPEGKIKQGELVTISWELKGKGNIQLATLPDIEWPRGVDTSEPSVKEELNPFVYPLSGTKTFNYAVTAKDTGQYLIPPVSFSYFDPIAEQYKTILAEPVNFYVSPSGIKQFFSMDKVKGLSDQPLHLYWFGAVALIIICWIIYQLASAKKPAEQEALKIPVTPVPVVYTREQLFENARKSLSNDDAKGFFREVQQVLWKIAADRCDVLPAALNKQNISFALQKQQIATPVINQFLTVLNECEWALYTPEHVCEDMEDLLERAVSVSDALYKTS